MSLQKINGLQLQRTEVQTNARIKDYLYKTTTQVCNVDIFTQKGIEHSDGSPLRPWTVPKKGQASDPIRSIEESKRRARTAVYDIAMCNQFEYMFTWTLDGELIDRYSPEEVYKKVSVFLRNASQRKGFKYVLIPEYHKQKENEERPAIHFHGLCKLGNVQIQRSIRKNGTERKDGKGRPVYNMLDWKFGWSTCVPLDEHYERAVNYVTKYITKSEEKIFGKWYLSSREIKKKPDVYLLPYIEFEQYKNTLERQGEEIIVATVFRDVIMISRDTPHDIDFRKEGTSLVPIDDCLELV